MEGGADVESFLMTYINVFMGRKREKDKAAFLFSNLDKEALVEYQTRFIVLVVSGS